MYLHHDEIKIMLEERHKDLIAQSYISKQIEEVGRTQGRPGVNWSILIMVKNFRTILAVTSSIWISSTFPLI